MCIVGSSKLFSELRVTPQPDKWQEVQDLGLTFFCTKAPQPSQVSWAWGRTGATARHFLPFVGSCDSLPSALNSLSFVPDSSSLFMERRASI